MILAALEARVRYGLDITQSTGLLPGTVYTTLRRLEKRNLVRGEWEAAKQHYRRSARLLDRAGNDLESVRMKELLRRLEAAGS